MIFISVNEDRCRFCGWNVCVFERNTIKCGLCCRVWLPLWDVVAVPC